MSYILGNCNNVKFSVQMKKRMYYNRKKCREKKNLENCLDAKVQLKQKYP